MTSTTARKLRLRSFFNAIIHGQRDLGSNGALFIEAVSSHPDPLICVTTIMSQPTNLSLISTAMTSLTSLACLNGIASDFLHFLRHKAIRTTNNGQYLCAIIKAVMHSQLFWPAFVRAFRLGELQEKGQVAFAFLLLQLLQLEDDPNGPIMRLCLPVAEDPVILTTLLSHSSEDVMSLGAQIERIVETGEIGPVDGPGGRHDNDFPNFRDIAILPTAGEVLYTDPPYLLTSDVFDDPETADERAEIYLDTQFRLLREDMLYEMKEELQFVLNPDSVKKKGRRGLVIEGLTISAAYCPENRRTPWGLCFKATQDLPSLNHIKDFQKRYEYLTKNDRGKRILKHNSLACLLADSQIVAFPVVHRDEELLAKVPPTIVLRFTGGKAISKILLKAKTAKSLKLVFIDTSIFSYEPVLKALQDMEGIPLSEELLFWSDQIYPKSSSPSRPKLFNVLTELKSNSQQDLRRLIYLPEPIKLDSVQGAALVTGLTEPVSLIQGPPGASILHHRDHRVTMLIGTGKSFIGALLARFIYEFTEETILVVCYTNHALDQFLVDLKDIGIPGDDIVRVGGKHNADTEDMSLHKQTSHHRFTPEDGRWIGEKKGEAEGHANEFTESFERYWKFNPFGMSELINHLRLEEQDYFHAFSVPADEDGMALVDKKGKAIDEYYLLQQWINGKKPSQVNLPPKMQGDLEKNKIWKMSKEERQAIRGRWEGDLLRPVVKKVCEHATDYGNAQKQLSRKFAEKDISILRSKRIIGCTTTGAAKYKDIIQATAPNVVLVEEAGEILESHVITALSKDTTQMILIGDHKQLRPKVNNYKLTFEKGEGYDLNVSLFERLIRKGYPHQVLEQQHRMRPEISALIRHLTYPDLSDAPRTLNRPNLRGVRDNIVFIDHTHLEDDSTQFSDRRDMEAKASKQNSFEVKMVMKIVQYLFQQGYKSEDLVILTPYLAQLYLIQTALKNAPEYDTMLNDLDSRDLARAGVDPHLQEAKKKKKVGIRLATIDNYQGEESNIVIASLCRSNSRNDIGFMFSPERLNVLLSRARNALIVIGNLNTFTNARKGKELWADLVNKLEEGNHIYKGFPIVCPRHPTRESTPKEPKDFDRYCPSGGCDQLCGSILSCGLHGCQMKCHVSSIDHSTIQCKMLLQETCNLGHKTPRMCFEPRSAHCKSCVHEAKLREAEARREQELLEKKARQQLAYEQEMRDLDALIIRERIEMDEQGSTSRDTMRPQHQVDSESMMETATSSVFRSPIPALLHPSPTIQPNLENASITTFISSGKGKEKTTDQAEPAQLSSTRSLAHVPRDSEVTDTVWALLKGVGRIKTSEVFSNDWR